MVVLFLNQATFEHYWEWTRKVSAMLRRANSQGSINNKSKKNGGFTLNKEKVCPKIQINNY